MAASTNGNGSLGSLVDEFEEASQACFNILTKDEAVNSLEKEDISVDVDHTLLKLIDLARQLEAFFLQKRFLLSALKPESVVKEDINDLKQEKQRKEELINRHYEKISAWLTILADVQVQSWAKSPAQNMPVPVPGAVPSQSATPTQGAPIGSVMQQQMQQQQMHQQMQQQMQQQQMVQQQMPQQAMFMQQQQQQGPPRFPVQGPGGMLQGPLAYLEKTTSNIGMPDGRR